MIGDQPRGSLRPRNHEEPSARTRVGIYIRVSSEEQISGYSIDAQRRKMEQFCEFHDGQYHIVQEFCDQGVSAKTDDIEKRPQFKAAVEALERGDIEYIMVHKLDRFARNMLLALSTLKRIDYHLICLDPTLDFSNPMGRMHANILMTFAQYFVENLSAETRKGLMERKEQGYWLGHLPFGVTRAEPLHGEDPRKLPPVRDAAPRVTDRNNRVWSRYDALRYIFERYSEGVSMTIVRQELCDIGFPLSTATISFILRNRFYLGEVPVKDPKNRNRVIEWLPGIHEPFIEPELFERARQMRYRGRRGSSHSGWTPTVHIFSGLCVCARCGSRMHCDRGRRSPRLICPTGHKEHACEQPTVRQGKIEEQILDVISRVSFPDEMIERAVAEAEGYARNDIVRERNRLEKRRKRLSTLFLDMEEMTREDYERQKIEIDVRLQQLRELDRPFDTKNAIVQFMRSLGEWYRDASPDEKQKALSLLFQTISIDGAYVSEVTFTPEADYLMRVLSRSSVWANSNRGT